MTCNTLVAIPALNEVAGLSTLGEAIATVRTNSVGDDRFDVLVVDDGSSDGTASIALRCGWSVVRHDATKGYGASLWAAFKYAARLDYRHVITMDADGQHPIDVLPDFLRLRNTADIVSGSRYLPRSVRMHEPLAPHVNQYMTSIVNTMLGLSITDVGCGMKSILVSITDGWRCAERGYLFPLEFWVNCSATNCTIVEIPIPMIYLDRTKTLERKFGSIDCLINEGVFVILRTLLGSDISYTSDYGATMALAGSSFAFSRATIGTLLALLAEGEKKGIAVSLASKNVAQLSRRIALAQ